VIVLYAALLGIIQGLTEFLPVSSSAHLILARAFFGWNVEELGLAFDVACHVGTLLAVIVYFRRELTAMLLAAPSALDPSPGEPGRQARLIVVGTLPVVAVGLLFKDLIESTLRTPPVAGLTLAAGAIVLLAADRSGARTRGEESLTWREALIIGVAQATALVPGVSRSGATIAVGLLFGLRRDAAARFGFLLGVPAILAAAGKESLTLARTGLSGDMVLLFAVGIVSSGLVGYLTVKYFIRYLAGHSLDVFVYYRLALALAVLVWVIV
jgi:undecaprenyl-diphosphatase